MRTTVRLSRAWTFLGGRVAPLTLVLTAVMCSIATGEKRDSREWQERLTNLRWVAYTPPSGNPNQRIEATPEAIRGDLEILRQAKFTGLVTYGSTGIMGREFPRIAQETGFKGLILGIWDPNNQREMAIAVAAAKNPIVLGYCVGNEGLTKRYSIKELSTAIDGLRKATGKCVTTTEEIDDYADEKLLSIGDWIFPNAHPYFHSRLDPDTAVQWTKAAYQDLTRRSKRFVMFKEVGLPTAGDPKGQLSDTTQQQYYAGLAQTVVRFVYFEAFDQSWKTHLPIEPHWGLFTSNRIPKLFAKGLLPPAREFYVYLDIDARDNHFKPTGFMGDTGDIHVDETCENKPHSGQTCIKVTYDAKGKGPSTAPYPGAAKWAGVYWQEPPNNWGTDEIWKGNGFDLSSYNRLVFWTRAEKDCRIEFKVGGINEKYGDSLKYARSKTAKLTNNWKEYEIDLREADLSHIIGGFCWATNWDTNPDGAIFYLDDIRFEKK